jgi:hypothetical protein
MITRIVPQSSTPNAIDRMIVVTEERQQQARAVLLVAQVEEMGLYEGWERAIVVNRILASAGIPVSESVFSEIIHDGFTVYNN